MDTRIQLAARFNYWNQIVSLIGLKGKERQRYLDTMFDERAEEISAFLLEDLALVKERMRMGTRLIKEEWEKVNPKTEQEIYAFYKNTKSYVYELTANECDLGKIDQVSQMLSLIDKHKPRSILVYGAGVGSEALPIVEDFSKIAVSVADVPSMHYKFCHLRAQLRELPIKFYLVKDNTYGAEIPEQFDMIVAMDVLEHVADPEQLAKNFYKILKDGGVLLAAYMFNKDSGFKPEKLNTHPCHITHNKQGVMLKGGHFKAYLKQLGFKCDWNAYGGMWIKELLK